MDFEEFSAIIQKIDYLLKLDENGRDLYPSLLSFKIALKRDYPELAEKLEEKKIEVN